MNELGDQLGGGVWRGKRKQPFDHMGRNPTLSFMLCLTDSDKKVYIPLYAFARPCLTGRRMLAPKSPGTAGPEYT